ncbi:alpha/beta fold hydrolase [Microbacterium sp. dk485]|uniref:alpha/beta fold hydrolase n=1 Tax=Microbacterium sp. dk485 TaxID=2560021 RepID=UPI0010732CD7|nr:alpha/beta fold hydrolase [Microbacterium sp. dk485]TFV85522.1 alpha/beta fold hydrolase [Microbacterium sp. dk485]
MDAAIPALTEMPAPQFVMTDDGVRLATYTWGEPDAPTVFCVHGFGSSTRDNWVSTGWVRELLRRGLRVLAVDQRGHGASDKPHDAGDYAMPVLVGDLTTMLDTYLLDSVRYLGYSLGGRVGWQLAVDAPEHVERAVLGGIPDGRPLARLQVEQARAYVDSGEPVTDPVTRRYVALAERVAGNDLRALIAVAEGMRIGDSDPDPAAPPHQRVLFATGSDDPIIEESRHLAGLTPNGMFFEIPGRHHTNAPGARAFRQAGADFLAEP